MNYFPFLSECTGSLFLWNGKCEETCPTGTFLSEPKTCQKCHYTCASCSGSFDYQCTACFGDAFLETSAFESYCYPKSLKTAIDYTKWYIWTCLILTINVVVAILGFIYFYWRNKVSAKSNSSHFIESVKYKLTTQNDSDSDN